LLKQFKRDAKMPICLWKNCEFASEEMAALQKHVITKHLQQQQQLTNLDKQNDVGPEEEQQDHGGPMAKKVKINEEEESKLINRGGQQR
jgi:hypothetical protein